MPFPANPTEQPSPTTTAEPPSPTPATAERPCPNTSVAGQPAATAEQPCPTTIAAEQPSRAATTVAAEQPCPATATATATEQPCAATTAVDAEQPSSASVPEQPSSASVPEQPSSASVPEQPAVTATIAPFIATADPFTATTRGLDDPHPARALLRAAGPIVQVPAPAGGGHVWIVTDDALARRVLVHPGIVKDPAYAPAGWDPRAAGLEPTAAEQPSLTTTDGPGHTRLRQAHSPLFTARRMAAFTGRVTTLARDLLARAAASGDPVDLAADFTTRYPLNVVCDVLGVPLDRVDEALSACRRMYSDDPEQVGQAMAAFADLAAAALENDRDSLTLKNDRDGLTLKNDRDAAAMGDGRDSLAVEVGRGGLAVQLLGNLPEEARPHIHYLLFTLIYAGQLTTDPSLGFLLARALDRRTPPAALDDLVRDTLRRHSPAPFTLWRFAGEDLDLAGVRLAARSPILIDIQGINTDPERSIGADLVFGAGPHYCTGAHLAQLELRILVEVLQEEYPDARLAVPYSELRQTDFGGIQGSRVTSLPVYLRG
ncbi:hypothetical protein [Nonomuraea typhae]|uniref:hypothetical protein n=1 Tax=Nonomuraea typhae TaxID=2603600 RepID=UPI0024844B64|nr:hypothetical protein [Nonomuraea typhae]